MTAADMPKTQRLAKWRVLFTGWQLGTRAKGDPEGDAVRDHREATLLLRAEVSAIAQLMFARDVFTVGEFRAAIEEEADLLSMALEAKFPGIQATNEGLVLDARAAETMKGWKP
jgi:hypothetical protein